MYKLNILKSSQNEHKVSTTTKVWFNTENGDHWPYISDKKCTLIGSTYLENNAYITVVEPEVRTLSQISKFVSLDPLQTQALD